MVRATLLYNHCGLLFWNHLSQFSQCWYIQNMITYKLLHLTSKRLLVQRCLMHFSVAQRIRIRDIIFWFLLIHHLFDKCSAEPAALEVETSNMQRKRILNVESSGMESTQNGIFISDDVKGKPGQSTHTSILLDVALYKNINVSQQQSGHK